MALVEMIMPKMGESVAEATVIKWLKNEGDKVGADEPIIEIATDKVDSEVPVPEDGVLVKHLCEEGDVVLVGKPIALFDTEAVGTAAATPQTSTAASNGNGADLSIPEPVQQAVAATVTANFSLKAFLIF